MGLPWWLSNKESAYNVGGVDSIPRLGRSWRKAWQSTPVFLPGKYHGQRSLAGYSPWGPKEWNTTEAAENIHSVCVCVCVCVSVCLCVCVMKL